MKIITICGSLKFKDEMMKIAEEMELKGNCVLNFFPFKCFDISVAFLIALPSKVSLSSSTSISSDTSLNGIILNSLKISCASLIRNGIKRKLCANCDLSNKS
mgnify:CR=1 FL=1